MSDAPIDLLIPRLDGVRQTGPNKWLARCPAHQDKSPSLSIRDADGKILLHCFAGCPVDDILAAVGLSVEALFPPREDTHYQRKNDRPGAPRWSRGELFDLVVHEASILALAIEGLLCGKTLSDSDMERVIQAREAVLRCAREVRR